MDHSVCGVKCVDHVAVSSVSLVEFSFLNIGLCIVDRAVGIWRSEKNTIRLEPEGSTFQEVSNKILRRT